jgi:molybdopterin-guanine dinucleotide biosynthesis protein A
MNLDAVILAGGESSRMGRDKACLELDGQPLIIRALHTLREVDFCEIFISGRVGGDYSKLGCPVLIDRDVPSGPLAGIERALDATEAPLLLVLAVDLPRMTSGFLRKLVKACDQVTGVIPKVRGQLEPLAAIYPKRCHFIVRDCLLKCRLAARDFAEACRRERTVRTVSVPGDELCCFENWNTPEMAGKQHKSYSG